MATYPYAFNCELKAGDTDPDVTVYVADTIVNEATGERSLYKTMHNPEIVKLSELSSYIATGMSSGIVRTVKPPGP